MHVIYYTLCNDIVLCTLQPWRPIRKWRNNGDFFPCSSLPFSSLAGTENHTAIYAHDSLLESEMLERHNYTVNKQFFAEHITVMEWGHGTVMCDATPCVSDAHQLPRSWRHHDVIVLVAAEGGCGIVVSDHPAARRCAHIRTSHHFSSTQTSKQAYSTSNKQTRSFKPCTALPVSHTKRLAPRGKSVLYTL